jgi:hypothetical protein
MFGGRPGDYFFMLLFNWACCVIVGLIADISVSITSYNDDVNINHTFFFLLGL